MRGDAAGDDLSAVVRGHHRGRCRGLTRTPPGGEAGGGWHPPGARCPRGARLSPGESRGKERQGAQPPGPPLRKGGSFPKDLFSGGGRLAGGGAFFDDWPAAHTAKGPKASRPPLGRLGALLFSLWGGPKNRNQKDKHKKYKKSGHAVCSSASLHPRLLPKGTHYRCEPPNRWAARLRSLAL